MTPTYFDSPERLAKLREASALLIGTPFFANSEAPGRDGGIDCVRTLNFLYRYCGAITQIQIPRQKMDHGQHSDRSLLIEAFETWPELRARFACVWKAESAPTSPVVIHTPWVAPNPDVSDFLSQFMPGDALCFLAGKVPHHGGVMLEGGDMLHTLRRDGVHVMRLDAVVRGWRVLGQLAAVYRPLPRCH